MDLWTGQDVRRLRQALRLTVRDFAEDLGVSPRTVSKWEAGGSSRIPRPELQAALDTLLLQATSDQQDRFETSAAVLSSAKAPNRFPGQAQERASDRFPLTVTGAQDPQHISIGQIRSMFDAFDEANGLDESQLVEHFLDRLEHCQTLDGSLGVEALSSALSIVAGIEGVCGKTSGPIRLQLLALASRSAEFVGWLFRDAGKLDRAIYWYNRALEWARESRSSAMQSYILLRQSQMAYEMRDPVRVSALARAAQHDRMPSAMKAEVLVQQALGQSMFGFPSDHIERYLDEAQNCLEDRNQCVQERLLGTSFTEQTWQLRTAVCFTEVGQTIRASDLFAEVLTAGTLSLRDTGFFTARRAQAFVRGAEPDEAVTLALSAFDIAAVTKSTRTMQVVSQIAVSLEPWSDRSAVQDLREMVLR